uniref:Uncharacterized protein n=1 Tax=Coturnix japonica TaxID=93934 RepID=A0A8C2T9K6_COTJA
CSHNQEQWWLSPGQLTPSIPLPEGKVRMGDDRGQAERAEGGHSLIPQWSLSHSPVLMTFWMALATCPLSRELRILTRRMRQVQSTTRDPASRTSPTARSGSGVSVKRCSPAPQHGWARVWGLPSPAHKPVPTKQPRTAPQHHPALLQPHSQGFQTPRTPSPTSTPSRPTHTSA